MEDIIEAGDERVQQVVPKTDNHSPVEMSLTGTWFLLRTKEISHVDIQDA